MTRQTLPNRRPNITLQTEWQGFSISVTVGYDPATGLPSEVFADVLNGGHMAETLKDACIWASKLLQHGCDDLCQSLGRVPDYTGAEHAASPLGVIAECVREARLP